MVQPLTKRHIKTGELYSRRPEVEQEIEVLLRLPTGTRLARARNGDLKSPDSMSDEALLYLVRDAHRRGAEDERNALIRPLFIRCQARLKRAMPDGVYANAKKLRDDALSDFCDLMLSDGSGEILIDWTIMRSISPMRSRSCAARCAAPRIATSNATPSFPRTPSPTPKSPLERTT